MISLMMPFSSPPVQDQLARAEGYNIVHADQQFIVPTDGKPIRWACPPNLPMRDLPTYVLTHREGTT